MPAILGNLPYCTSKMMLTILRLSIVRLPKFHFYLTLLAHFTQVQWSKVAKMSAIKTHLHTLPGSTIPAVRRSFWLKNVSHGRKNWIGKFLFFTVSLSDLAISQSSKPQVLISVIGIPYVFHYLYLKNERQNKK